MPKRSSKKRPADTNRLAHQIVQESLGEALPNEGKTRQRSLLAVRVDSRAARPGRAKMTKEERSEAARKAAGQRKNNKKTCAIDIDQLCTTCGVLVYAYQLDNGLGVRFVCYC